MNMSIDPAETPQVVTVSEGFYVRQAVDNIAWIDLGGFAVAVDALEHAELEDEVFEAIASTIGETPVRYMLNTHTHYDHVALNAAFRRRYGAEVIDNRSGGIPAEGRWFEGRRRRAQMIPLGGCHTAEDCIVWIPEDKALFTGDLFGWGLIPTTRPLDASLAQRLTDAYERMIAFDAVTVIPGHGPLCTTAELRRWVEYFGWLRRRCAELCATGAGDEVSKRLILRLEPHGEIVRELSPPEDMLAWWRFVQWKHENSLSKVLQAVRRERLGAQR